MSVKLVLSKDYTDLLLEKISETTVQCRNFTELILQEMEWMICCLMKKLTPQIQVQTWITHI
jgi:hypothetical protein